MKRILFIMALLSVMITNVNAGLYPVVSSLTTTIDQTWYRYDATWQLVDIPAADQPIPYDWTMTGGYRMDTPEGKEILAFSGHPSGPEPSCTTGTCAGRIKDNETFSSAAMRITDDGRKLKPGSFWVPMSTVQKICVGYVVIPPSADVGYFPWSGVLQPGSTCVVSPPATGFCNITTPAITLDHGQLTVSDANGSEVSQKVNMRCTTATKITLRLASDVDYIALQNNARAKIKIDNKKVGGTFDFPQGDSQVEVKSILEGITQAGDYDGITVLVVEPA